VRSCEDGAPTDVQSRTIYRSGLGKILHMMKWSRHDILNRARELSCFMSLPTGVHVDRLYRLLNYIKMTADFGNYLKPDVVWDGIDKTFEFVISGRSDSEYASDPD
jgi:hypothetical protein